MLVFERVDIMNNWISASLDTSAGCALLADEKLLSIRRVMFRIDIETAQTYLTIDLPTELSGGIQKLQLRLNHGKIVVPLPIRDSQNLPLGGRLLNIESADPQHSRKLLEYLKTCVSHLDKKLAAT
jgi:hypothetical protein